MEESQILTIIISGIVAIIVGSIPTLLTRKSRNAGAAQQITSSAMELLEEYKTIAIENKQKIDALGARLGAQEFLIGELIRYTRAINPIAKKLHAQLLENNLIPIVSVPDYPFLLKEYWRRKTKE